MTLLSSLRGAFSRSTDARTDVDASRPGQDLLNQLDAYTSSFRKGDTRSSERADALRVHGDRQLLTQLPPKGGAVPLDASRISDSAVIMAAPQGRREVMAFAEGCVNNKISQVIDLTYNNDIAGNSAHGVKDWTEKAVGTKAIHFAKVGRARWANDHESNVQRVAFGLSDRRDMSVAQEVTWSRMPHHADKAPVPKKLLEACRQIMEHEQLDGSSVAFLDGNGGHIAATFAAANALFRRHRDKALTPDAIDSEVMSVCSMLRARRSPELFVGRPDLLDSLTRFAGQLIEEGRARPTTYLKQEADRKDMAKIADHAETVPQVVHEAPAAPKKSNLRVANDPRRDLAANGEAALRRRGIRFDERLKVSTFELGADPRAVDRLGDQGVLDSAERVKKTMTGLRQQLAEVEKTLREPNIQGNDAQRLATLAFQIKAQIANRQAYMADLQAESLAAPEVKRGSH